MSAKLTKEIVNERIKHRGISLVGEYINARTKALFRCSENHKWPARPDAVMRGTGCRVCTINQLRSDAKLINERIADRGLEMIGDYVNVNTKTLFRCAEKHEWMATPGNVTNASQPTGCPHCSGKAPLTKDIVNERIADRGLVMVSEYVTNMTKALFRCSENHEWPATPDSVMRVSGCPHCATSGFNPSAPASLYYIRFDTARGQFWKIGVTNRDAASRFYTERAAFVVLNEWNYDTGREALDAEQEILAKFATRRYKGTDVLTSGGNTELFVKDVLGLDRAVAA